MSKHFTPSQLEAVNLRGGHITVSAAAGSGKTSVLINRILEYLKAGGDIERLLTVTFTVSAASEIKDRLLAGVNEELSRSQNEHMMDQSLKLHKMPIYTIDSFCSRLTKRYFDELGISPVYKIYDETEYRLLRQDAAAETVDLISEDSRFAPLFENFLTGRSNDLLEQILIHIDDCLSGIYDKNAFMKKCIEMFGPKKDLWIENILMTLKDSLSYAYELYTSAGEKVIPYPEYDSLTEFYRTEKAHLEACLTEAYASEWDILFELMSQSPFKRLDIHKLRGDSGYEEFKESRSSARDIYKECSALMVSKSTSFLSDCRISGHVTQLLFQAYEIYEDLRQQKNKANNKLCFGDILRLSAELVIESYDAENDRLIPSEAAKNISGEYDEILIDEYQDTNRLQDILFRAISKNENNIFIVGDVKQSIYAFRGAEPSVFLKKCRSGTGGGFPKLITLSENFRSSESVIDFINYIFGSIMRYDTGGISYSETDKLLYGASYYDSAVKKSLPELVLIDSAESAESAEKESAALEAKYICGEIKTLIDSGFGIYDKSAGTSRKVRLSDIAIITRNNKTCDSIRKVLVDSGISAYTEERDDFFEKYEIKVMLSLLTVINNPRDSIAMVSAMRSPLFGFTDDELASIRAASKKGAFYDAVVKYSVCDKKTEAFCSFITKYSAAAADYPVYRLLIMLYSELMVYPFFAAMPNAAERERNLTELLRNAKKFEDTGLKGLHNYIRYIKSLIETNNTLHGIMPVIGGEYVRIMTIHKAKGLEFPICFLSGIFGKFSAKSLQENVLFDREFGLAFDIADQANRKKYKTIPSKSMRLSVRQLRNEEEMRLLYVALTRAREKLYIVGSCSSLKKRLADASRLSREGNISSHIIRRAGCYADWLLPLALISSPGRALREYAECKAELQRPSADGLFEAKIISSDDLNIHITASQNQASEIKTNLGELKAALEYIYPHTGSDIPVKISVSEVKKRNSDIDAYNNLLKNHQDIKNPDFVKQQHSGTFYGSAIHKFLRYSDWSKCGNEEGILSESVRLNMNEILSSSEKEVLDTAGLLSFFRNETTKQLLLKEELLKEKRFTVRLPANEIMNGSESDEHILLQGTIDCFCIENDTAFLIDYKTDRVGVNDGESLLVNRYSLQLKLYEKALLYLYDIKKVNKSIYSFSLRRYIPIK